MFALQWDYLLDKSFASEWGEREKAEWPPHPDRVFQALVAAWGETGRDCAGRAALEWMEALPPPQLLASGGLECSAPTVFVPANDAEGGKKGNWEILPSKRVRGGRKFPSVSVQKPCALVWPDAEPSAGQKAALGKLCASVTHIGMSRSLVGVRIVESLPASPNYRAAPDGKGTLLLRVPSRGRLEALVSAYADGGARWRRPPVAKWQDYCAVDEQGQPFRHSVFGTGKNWIIFAQCGGRRFLLDQAPRIAETMRETLIRAADGDPVAMRLISGHGQVGGGAPLTEPHTAIVALGFVGSAHADGHLLGLAVILPSGISYNDADAVRQAVARAQNPETGEITLTFGSAGTVMLREEQREIPPFTLRPETWCGASKRWASVTPIVCDRMPPRPNRYEGWADQQVRTMCGRIGLPEPKSVRVSAFSPLLGAPSCKDVAPLMGRGCNGPRWHLHADIRFSEPVFGPVILGAGRFRGYGLCKPMREAEDV